MVEKSVMSELGARAREIMLGGYETNPIVEVDDPKTFVVQDSGKRQEFQTGSVRDTREGKGRYDLLPCYAIERLAKHFENGAKKYGDSNWRRGQPLSRYMDSAMRHLFKAMDGQRDEDHLIACVWNLMCLVETENYIIKGELPTELYDIKIRCKEESK